MLGYRIKRREDVEPLCPMKTCLCFDLRMGTFLAALTTLVLSLFAWILVVLDMAAWVNPEFQVEGSYYTWWRTSFWKGFYTCDIMMIIIHPVIIILSIILCIAILMPSSFRLYSLYPIVKAWYVLMILYTITEAGVAIYTYSFYGLAAWRLPFLIFSHMYYIIRFVLSIWFIGIVYSYSKEIEDELTMPLQGGHGSESTDYLYQPATAIVSKNGIEELDPKAIEAKTGYYVNSNDQPRNYDYYPRYEDEVQPVTQPAFAMADVGASHV